MTKPNYDETNRGVMFEEADKRTEKSPDWGGSGKVNDDLIGQTIALAGWLRMGDRGRRMSLSFSKKRDGDTSNCTAGSGMIFAVREKRSEKSPDFEGNLHIPEELRGKEMRIAAWRNEDGSLKLSLSERRPKG